MTDPHAQTSKFLSFVLRHHPESIGITLDSQGWANIDTLLAQAAQHNRPISREQLLDIVATNPKKRFTLSSDQTQIRAAQGHSTAQVAIAHSPVVPPATLYHGTATRFLDSIRSQGLIAGSRHHVHLSADIPTAQKVGQRHGKPIVLRIHAAAMHAAGHAFYLSDNQVWLTDHVPAPYISEE